MIPSIATFPNPTEWEMVVEELYHSIIHNECSRRSMRLDEINVFIILAKEVHDQGFRLEANIFD
jgi:hypothetical protein